MTNYPTLFNKIRLEKYNLDDVVSMTECSACKEQFPQMVMDEKTKLCPNCKNAYRKKMDNMFSKALIESFGADRLYDGMEARK